MADNPTGRDRQVRLGRILGLLFVLTGFVTLTVGWWRMASVDTPGFGGACLDCMLPYLLSAGAVGLGEIMFGCTLLVLSSYRAERLRLLQGLMDVNRSVALLGTSMEASANPGAANGRVVAGKSTYHRPECRLVKGRENLDMITVKMAEASGLSACRVCNPETADV